MQLIVPHNKLTNKMQNVANMYDLYRHEVEPCPISMMNEIIIAILLSYDLSLQSDAPWTWQNTKVTR